MPRETSRIAVEKYENGAFNPSTAPRPRPTIPLLPLDTSPALQKYRARSAMTEEEKQKQKAAAKAAAAAGKASTSTSSSTEKKEKETPVVAAATLAAENTSRAAPSPAAAAAAVKEPPPSLSKWLPKSFSSKKKNRENDGDNDNGSKSGSPTVLSSSPTSTSAPPTDISTSFENTDHFEESSAQGGIDVLAAILSPDKNKPAHTQVINALMRTAPGPTPAEEATSAASAPRSKRSLGGFVENVQVITSSRQASGRNNSTGGDAGNWGGNHSARYVKSVSSGRSSTEPWWKTPLIAILGAAAAVVVTNLVHRNKDRGIRDAGAGRRGGRGGVQHAGRW